MIIDHRLPSINAPIISLPSLSSSSLVRATNMKIVMALFKAFKDVLGAVASSIVQVDSAAKREEVPSTVSNVDSDEAAKAGYGEEVDGWETVDMISVKVKGGAITDDEDWGLISGSDGQTSTVIEHLEK